MFAVHRVARARAVPCVAPVCARRNVHIVLPLADGLRPMASDFWDAPEACRARMKAIRGVQMAAKGVGEAFTGGRDLHQMLHALRSTTISVEAYFSQPSFERVLPDNLKQWAASLCGEAKEAYKRLKKRVEEMEKDGVRGAAESTFHAVSSAAGAITGIAMLDVGRHIADELLQTTAALNDVLARATRLVTLANCAMLEKLAEDKGLTLPTAMEVNPLLTKLEIDNIRARIWVHQIEDGSVVAGDKMSVTWDTIGQVPLVNVRLKNSMGVETSRGKTVQRLTVEAGRPTNSFEDVYMRSSPPSSGARMTNISAHAHSGARAHTPTCVERICTHRPHTSHLVAPTHELPHCSHTRATSLLPLALVCWRFLLHCPVDCRSASLCAVRLLVLFSFFLICIRGHLFILIIIVALPLCAPSLFSFFFLAGEPNKGFVNDVLPLDFVPGKYTVAVSDPSNNIRGMAFVSVSWRMLA